MNAHINNLSDNVNSHIKPYLSVLDNKFISVFLTTILIVYASLAAPHLPPYISKLFNNNLFKAVVFFLIAFVVQRDAGVALIVTIVAIALAILLNKYNTEYMMNVAQREGMEKNLETCNEFNCSKSNKSNKVYELEEPYASNAYDTTYESSVGPEPDLEGDDSINLHKVVYVPSEADKIQQLEATLGRPLTGAEHDKFAASGWSITNFMNYLNGLKNSISNSLSNNGPVEAFEDSASSNYSAINDDNDNL